ncbi:MAG: hypothetical protein KAG18_08620 [Sinobacterium sp.]|nr:hypothetical protein [Sinobacterium sp.]
MLLSESSDLVIRHLAAWRESPEIIDLIFLKGGPVLAIAPTSISLYKNEDSILDPLSNGLISSAQWPAKNALSISLKTKGLVASFKAGVIHLAEGKTLLITPVSIQLFLCANDALHNRDAVAHIEIS